MPETQQHITCKHEADFGSISATLANINQTLNDLKKILVSHATLESRVNTLGGMVSEIFERLHKMELAQANHHGKSFWSDKVLWYIISTAIGAFLLGNGIKAIM